MNVKIIKSILVNSLIFSAILLNNSFTSLMIQFTLFIICIILMSSYTVSISKFLFVLTIVISIFFNFFNIEFKDLIRIIQIAIAFSFFPLKIEFSFVNKTLIAAIMIFITFMTISNILELNFENTFKNIFYPIETNPWASDFSYMETGTSILLNRYATFFYNPNLLGQTTLLLLIIYLIIINNNKMNFFDISILICGIFCLIVSGGRTSFLIFGIILFLTIIWRMRLIYRYILSSLIVSLIIFKLSESRLLQIVSNDENMDSVGIKFAILKSYIQTIKFDPSSFFKLFFGTMKSDIQFDNDIGAIFYFTGLSSILFFIYFFFKEFWKSNYRLKPYYVFVLISISATIIFNFKFLILTIVILSLLRNNTQEIYLQNGSID